MPFAAPGRRRLVVGGVVLAIAAAAGTAAVVQLRAGASWQAMLAEERALRAEVRRAATARTPLWGEGSDESSSPHYARAMATAGELLRTDNDAMVAQLRASDADVFAGKALRERWQPVVAALRAGAAATRCGAATDTDGPAPHELANLLQCRWVANAAVFEARALRHAGRHLDAVRHTLDAAVFGADLLRHGVLIDRMIGAAVVAIGTREPWTDAALAALDRTALDELATGLARLDTMLPEGVDLGAELAFLARQLREAASTEPWLPSASASWRHGFSTRWTVADGFLDWSGRVRALASSPATTWSQRELALERTTSEAAASTNPLLAVVVPNLTAAERSHRTTVAGVRLLRMAVDVHRGVEATPLADPLGDGPLRVEPLADGTTRLASAGADVEGDGGANAGAAAWLRRTVRPRR